MNESETTRIGSVLYVPRESYKKIEIGALAKVAAICPGAKALTETGFDVEIRKDADPVVLRACLERNPTLARLFNVSEWFKFTKGAVDAARALGNSELISTVKGTLATPQVRRVPAGGEE